MAYPDSRASDVIRVFLSHATGGEGWILCLGRDKACQVAGVSEMRELYEDFQDPLAIACPEGLYKRIWLWSRFD